MDSLRDAAFDSYLPEFALTDSRAGEGLGRTAGRQPDEEQTRGADRCTAQVGLPLVAASVPTTVAVFWGEDMWTRSAATEVNPKTRRPTSGSRRGASPTIRLDALAKAVDKIAADFGKWETPWATSTASSASVLRSFIPSTTASPAFQVPFTSVTWGSLASFGTRIQPGMKKWYGVPATALSRPSSSATGSRKGRSRPAAESGDPKSPHFNDQAERYAAGNLRDVYFYSEQLKGHTTRGVQPGK
jgi:acyl-homoserine-lactone acylase